MLDAGRAPESIGGLTLFFDHADEQRRYVLAEAPRLAADPEPRLSLVLFRGETSGGLLQFEARLAPSEAQLAAAERTLTATGRKPVFARPDWRTGKISLAGWLQAQELRPRLLVVASPLLVGDPVAVIAARLDQAAAAMAAGALHRNALPTAVIFELETLGLAGALGVQVEADLQALHDRLTAEGALTTPYGRARIAKTWESAARDNLIRVHVIDESGDVEGRRAEAMRQVGEDLISRMFSPFPPPERPAQLNDGTVAPLELSFRLTVRREELATTSKWDFRERRAVPIKHYAGASLVDLLGDSPPDRHIRTTGPGDAVWSEFAVRAEPELARLGLAALEVDLRPTTSTSIARTVTLTDAQPEVRFNAANEGDRIQYRVRTHFDPTRTSAKDRETDWMDADTHLVVVSARRLFPPRSLTVIAGQVEFDWLDRVEVIVGAEGEPPKPLELKADAQTAEAFFAAAGDRPLSLTAHWRGRAGEPSRSDPPRSVEDDVFVLDSPFADSINVVAVPVPLQGVDTIFAELRTAHGDLADQKTLTWNAPDWAPQYAGLRRLVGSARTYQYRSCLVRVDGTVQQSPWFETDAHTLIVGADQPVNVHRVDVVLLGGGAAGRGCLAVSLRLEAGDNCASEVLEGDRDSATLVLVAPKSGPAPVLVMSEYLATGKVRETRWNDPSALIVVAPGPIVTP